MSSRKSDRRSKVGAGGEPKTPGRAAGGSGGGQFEWGGKHYTAMTELLRAIQKDSPGQPEDYYQGIFENKFKLTAVQFKRALAGVQTGNKKKTVKASTPMRSGRRRSSSPESETGGSRGSASRPSRILQKIAPYNAPGDREDEASLPRKTNVAYIKALLDEEKAQGVKPLDKDVSDVRSSAGNRSSRKDNNTTKPETEGQDSPAIDNHEDPSVAAGPSKVNESNIKLGAKQVSFLPSTLVHVTAGESNNNPEEPKKEEAQQPAKPIRNDSQKFREWNSTNVTPEKLSQKAEQKPPAIVVEPPHSLSNKTETTSTVGSGPVVSVKIPQDDEIDAVHNLPTMIVVRDPDEDFKEDSAKLGMEKTTVDADNMSYKPTIDELIKKCKTEDQEGVERKKSEAEMKALLRKYDTEDQKKAGEAEVMEVDVVEDGPEEVCLDDTSEEDEAKVGEPVKDSAVGSAVGPNLSWTKQTSVAERFRLQAKRRLGQKTSGPSETVSTNKQVSDVKTAAPGEPSGVLKSPPTAVVQLKTPHISVPPSAEHYPSNQYYQAVSATNMPQKEAEQKPRRKNIFNIPCKVEFYNARGEKSEVGQMEFSDKGFQARGKNNNEVIYSLPRKPQDLSEEDEFACRFRRETQINCGMPANPKK